MSGWQTVDIAGKPADLFEPAGGPPRFAIIYLHTYGMESLAANETFTRLFEELRLACVCPQGKRCWWADRICPEFDERVTSAKYVAQDVLSYSQQRWNLPPRGVGLLGVSMGGQGALRFALRDPETFPVVSAISPAVEYQELYWSGTPIDEMYSSKEQCRQDTALMHINPSHWPPHVYFCMDRADPWFRGCDRLREKLAALGVPHQCDLSSRGGGHSWDYFNQMAEPAVKFLFAGLEKESRRLI